MYITGIVAFALFFINDFNDWKLNKAWLKICFPVGFALLLVSTVWQCFRGDGELCFGLAARVVIWLVCLLMLVAEFYSLFFSFDMDEAYSNNTSGNDRVATTTRMYALCRHPGVLFFILLYACLFLSTHMTAMGALILCGLNFLLIVFEDIFVFPALLSGYDEYKRNTPFLIPSTSSIAKCLKDFRE